MVDDILFCMISVRYYCMKLVLVFKQYVGDGFCDDVNNHASCAWDDGDCCVSTNGGPIETYPIDCGEACRCRDPNALENQPRGDAALDPGNNLYRRVNHVRSYFNTHRRRMHSRLTAASREANRP